MKKFKKLFFVFAIHEVSKEINNLYRVGVNFKIAFNNMLEGCSVDNKRIRWEFTIFSWNKH